MGGLMMEVGLMMGVGWVDDGDWVDDRRCSLFSLFDH